MACDVRIAAEAAVFGQPEIKLGIIPGFGGTQRLARLVGPNKALEMNLVGDAVLSEEALEFGLVNRVVPDHELFETALMWGRKLAAQAPVAVGLIKSVSAQGRPRRGHRGREAGLRQPPSPARTPRRASAPSSASAPPSGAASSRNCPPTGRYVDSRATNRPVGPCGADAWVGVHGGADRRGDLGAFGDSRLPHAGDRALGERRPDGGRPHRRLRARPGALLVLLPAALPVARRQTAQPRPRGAGRARAPRPASRA